MYISLKEIEIVSSLKKKGKVNEEKEYRNHEEIYVKKIVPRNLIHNTFCQIKHIFVNTYIQIFHFFCKILFFFYK